MRIALLFFTVTVGSIIGVNAITTISDLQDQRQQRFCEQISSLDTSYDEMCKDFR